MLHLSFLQSMPGLIDMDPVQANGRVSFDHFSSTSTTNYAALVCSWEGTCHS